MRELAITSASEVAKINKTLTAQTKKRVLKNHHGCQYFDPKTKRICGSHFASEDDYKTPLWAGGDHSIENLTTLCSNHNKHRYRKQAQMKFI